MAGSGGYNAFEMARAQFDKIADMLDLEKRREDVSAHTA